MSAPSTVLPFQPATMSTAQLAAVSYLARYAGRTHVLYAFQLREWFAWCQSNGLDPVVGIQRAHVELHIRGLGDRRRMARAESLGHVACQSACAAGGTEEPASRASSPRISFSWKSSAMAAHLVSQAR